MTVRFPVVVEASEVVSGGGTRLDRVEVPGVVDHGLLLGLLPRDRLISWTLDGVRTRRPRVEVVRMLRQRIVDDFSNGRCLLARGWILSETEWCLLHLSSIRPA